MISLGHFCSTALELQRYGLRDGSYPLDWNISHIEPTMALVESGFQGFLQLELLERDPERSDVVNDKGSGIAVYNSFSGELPIAAQYETVRARYARRIKRYRRAVAQPTLFVRYMVDGEEFSYLDEHMPAVLAALRKTNPGNDLLLIGNADLPATCGGLPVYTVEVDDGDVVARRFAGKNRGSIASCWVSTTPCGCASPTCCASGARCNACGAGCALARACARPLSWGRRRAKPAARVIP